ncbi:hypothetical protein [Sphaerisporangium sp. TRM90804]|uniref:hypothetical protein n=1 Tax=Sphaerisporangium sp. TRM90804 TaxID=3031113 RepID=UPI00244BE81E|nr:hypothetical protein [Sphaerisporangium sp. TRM90804]MDH2429666.1 hypothetical protein [Sphaerisporangium sp. TRM90804]
MATEYGGVHISGGHVSGPIAFGAHASATVNNIGVPALSRDAADLLDRLEQAIAAHAASIDEPGKASRDLADVRSELREASPDQGRVLDALKRIAVRAAEVTVVVELVTKIRELFA